MLVDQLTHAAAADLGRGGRSLGMPPLAAPGFTPAAMAPPAGDVAGVATTPATRAAARGAPLGVAQGGAAGAPALLQTGSLPAATAAPAAACSGVSCVPRNAAAPLLGAGVVADDAAVALAESREHGQLGLATNQTVCPRNTPAHDDARSLMRLCAHEQKTSPRQSLQFQRNWDQRNPSACRCWRIAPQRTRCMPRRRLRACPWRCTNSRHWQRVIRRPALGVICFVCGSAATPCESCIFLRRACSAGASTCRARRQIRWLAPWTCPFFFNGQAHYGRPTFRCE